MNLRLISAQVIYRVWCDGVSLTEALLTVSSSGVAARDDAFVQAVAYGVCRWFYRLDAILQALLDKPLKDKDRDLQCLLLVGLYQLIDMRVPPHAAVAETVAAVKGLKKAWAKGLLNALLRRFLREKEHIIQKITGSSESIVASFAHPAWFIAAMQRDWPDAWEALLIANNQHPPMTLRVNQLHSTRSDYMAQLTQQGLSVTPVLHTQMGVQLTQPIDVMHLPGFVQGHISVQDGAAQLAAELLQLASGQRVLDACAAPGGKAAHMLEYMPSLKQVVAVDAEATRLQRMHDNLARLHLSAEVVCADVGDIVQWWDGDLFDRILLDAPCSASGVIRRHPDIKLLRREDDISKLAEEQLRLLTSLWPTLKKQGMLLYVTCSVFARENAEVLQRFVAQHQDAIEETISADWGRPCVIGRQVLPGMHDMDGFYFACLRKG